MATENWVNVITGTVGNGRGKSYVVVFEPFCSVVLDVVLLELIFIAFWSVND